MWTILLGIYHKGRHEERVSVIEVASEELCVFLQREIHHGTHQQTGQFFYERKSRRLLCQFQHTIVFENDPDPCMVYDFISRKSVQYAPATNRPVFSPLRRLPIAYLV